MCGRYTIFIPPDKLKTLFGTENLIDYAPRFNAAPKQDLPLIIHRRMGLARWGLPSEWAQSENKKPAINLINARSETLPQKPSFRESWVKKRRCLIPANGFYEWARLKNSGPKQPYYIYSQKAPVLAFAGLWSAQKSMITFTILTRAASEQISKLHNRMPVIIPPQRAEEWFKSSCDNAYKIINTASTTQLTYHPVDKKVGNVSYDNEGLISACAVI